MTNRLFVASLAQLQQHAQDLAAAFHVRLIVSSQLQPHEALALPHLGLVLTADIVDETTYAVALHEMGHLCAALGVVRGVVEGDLNGLKRLEESAAWEWARHYALSWTDAMEAVARYAEGTYAAAPPPPPARKPQPQIDWSKYR